MSRLARYTAAAVLILAAVPTFAGAGEAFKSVFVENTAENPVPVQGVGTQQIAGAVQVSNLPATRQLRHGWGHAHRNPSTDVMIPNDVVLTDLVITRLHAPETSFCETALFEQRGTTHDGMQFVYSTHEDRTQQLHFESGLTLPDGADGWGVALNSDCVIKVLWSGYTLP